MTSRMYCFEKSRPSASTASSDLGGHRPRRRRRWMPYHRPQPSSRHITVVEQATCHDHLKCRLGSLFVGGVWNPSPAADHAMRTAPMGPSNGMTDSINAAEAPFRAGHVWVLMSAPHDGADDVYLIAEPVGEHRPPGRSMRRQVRIADSGARPSRRKNERGSCRRRTSAPRFDGSGKKLAPGRGDLAPVAVTGRLDLPICASTAPSARPARRPTSNDIVFSDR
jgi:hypothetical protein